MLRSSRGGAAAGHDLYGIFCKSCPSCPQAKTAPALCSLRAPYGAGKTETLLVGPTARMPPGSDRNPPAPPRAWKAETTQLRPCSTLETGYAAWQPPCSRACQAAASPPADGGRHCPGWKLGGVLLRRLAIHFHIQLHLPHAVHVGSDVHVVLLATSASQENSAQCPLLWIQTTSWRAPPPLSPARCILTWSLTDRRGRKRCRLCMPSTAARLCVRALKQLSPRAYG